MVLGSRTVYSGILVRHENAITRALRFMQCIKLKGIYK